MGGVLVVILQFFMVLFIIMLRKNWSRSQSESSLINLDPTPLSRLKVVSQHLMLSQSKLFRLSLVILKLTLLF